MTSKTSIEVIDQSHRYADNGSNENYRVAGEIRVSNSAQTEGYGPDAQRNSIYQTCEQIDRPVEIALIIKEEGISGTKFPRAALMKILELARENEIDAVAVKDISRVGRLACPTMAFVWMLKDQYDVDLITENGIVNVYDRRDLIPLYFEAINAEIDNQFRSNNVLSSQAESFRDGNFHVTGRKVRFGYKKVEGEDDGVDPDTPIQKDEDIEKDPEKAEVIKTAFQVATDIGPVYDLFAKIQDRLADKFEDDQLPRENVRLRSLLRNPIYVGQPTWEIEMSAGEVKKAVMERDDLAIVAEDTFEEVQKILDQREIGSSKNTTGDNQSDSGRLSLRQMSSLIGISRLVAFDDIVRIHCPECGVEMQDNGKWRASGDIRPTGVTDIPEDPILKRYTCPNEDCERSEKRFPNEFEAYQILNTDIPLRELTDMR